MLNCFMSDLPDLNIIDARASLGYFYGILR